jgi:hypothetical protein
MVRSGQASAAAPAACDKRLDLALLIDRQHRRVGRRIQIKADDVGHLLGELRIARALKTAHPMRLQLMRLPDVLHRAQRDPDGLGHRPTGPCVAPGGGSPQVSATARATVSAGIGGLPGLRVLSRSSPSGPSSAKRCCQRHTTGRLTSVLPLAALGRRFVAASTTFDPFDMLARLVAVRRDRLKPLPVRRAQQNTYSLCHPHRLARCSHVVNRQNVSEHWSRSKSRSTGLGR